MCVKCSVAQRCLLRFQCERRSLDYKSDVGGSDNKESACSAGDLGSSFHFYSFLHRESLASKKTPNIYVCIHVLYLLCMYM